MCWCLKIINSLVGLRDRTAEQVHFLFFLFVNVTRCIEKEDKKKTRKGGTGEENPNKGKGVDKYNFTPFRHGLKTRARFGACKKKKVSGRIGQRRRFTSTFRNIQPASERKNGDIFQKRKKIKKGEEQKFSNNHGRSTVNCRKSTASGSIRVHR
jgi:hypothetical protein